MKKQATKAKNSNQKLESKRGSSPVERSRMERRIFTWPGPHPLSKVHSTEYQKVATMLCIQMVTSAIDGSSVRGECIQSAMFLGSLIPRELFNMCVSLSESLVQEAQANFFASRPQGTYPIVNVFSEISARNEFLALHSDAKESTDEEILEHVIDDIHLFSFDWGCDTSD